MKTIKLFGIALLLVLVSISFPACSSSSSDNVDNGVDSSASIVGVWYVKSIISYEWDTASQKFDMSKASRTKNYNDYETKYTHTFTEISNGYQDKYTDGYDDWYGINELVHQSGNTYQLYDVHKSNNKKDLVGKAYVKSVDKNRMVIEYEWTENEYNIVTFMR
jgi:hypothetical protein